MSGSGGLKVQKGQTRQLGQPCPRPRAIPSLLWIIASLCLALNAAQAQNAWQVGERTTMETIADGAVFFEHRLVADGRKVRMQALKFSARQFQLVVINQPQPDGRLNQAMQSDDFIAGMNGGYFTPEFRPLGLVVSGGELHHAMQNSRLLSGVFAATRDRMFLLRKGEFRLGPRTRDAIQAGPFLVQYLA